ncbi:ribonuclease HII [Mesobacillus zeae]
MKLTIEEIGNRLAGISNPESDFVRKISSDERAGVQRVLKKWLKLQEQRKFQEERFFEMSAFERDLRSKGYKYIAGIDEAGRGPLAGPVVAGSVILPADFNLPGLDDSKKLSPAKREEYYEVITRDAIAWGTGIIDAKEIDRINILQAAKKAMLAAVVNMKSAPDFLLVDAVSLETPYPAEALIKGDARSISIAAASVVAKVTRDRMMKEISLQYPEYGFSANMGYGTAEHLEALRIYGITPYHRKSFAPVKACLES